MIDGIKIKATDNVVTALRDIAPNEEVSVACGERKKCMRVTEPIPFGHKFADRDIAMGDSVVKYGVIIGRATREIPLGAHAHVHNIESLRGRGDWNE